MDMIDPHAEDDATRTLGEQQLRNARSDARLGHGREAIVADWWGAVEAAERTRTTAINSIYEMAQTSLDRPDDSPGSESYARWERAELARFDLAADNVELNAMTLIALLSALDALVEAIVPSAREAIVRMHFAERVRVVKRSSRSCSLASTTRCTRRWPTHS